MSPLAMSYQVNIDIFRGPLDLLLFLVRRHEVEIAEIPIAVIADQYLEYLEVLQELDVNAVGDFLVMASTLMELKSREALPRGDEVDEQLDDPRQDLVRHLLEYKKYKDAAGILEERGRSWQDRIPRRANDLPTRERNLADEPIREVELWDLVSAFGRIMRERQIIQPSSIIYDDTPIQVYMEQIRKRLVAEGSVRFANLFDDLVHKSALIGVFLAVLELSRYEMVNIDQEDNFGDLWILPRGDVSEPIDFSSVNNYEHPTDDDDDAS